MHRYLTLLPLMCVTAYFVAGLIAFSVRTWRRGLPVDPEVAGRPASPLLGRYLRHYIMWVLAPYERTLVRLHITPNVLTLASLATAIGAGVALGLGAFAVGGWLYLLAGILDILDGRVARATGRVTRGGAFFDSVIDRYAEIAVFAGLAFYYRSTWVLAAVLLAAMGSVMVSYVRARGEALGVDVKIGTMQRPERLLYLGAILAHSPLWEALRPSAGRPMFPPAIAALVLLGLSANVTAVRRIVHTLRKLDEQPAEAGAALATPLSPPAATAEIPGVAVPVDGAATRRPAGATGSRPLLARPRPIG